MFKLYMSGATNVPKIFFFYCCVLFVFCWILRILFLSYFISGCKSETYGIKVRILRILAELKYGEVP